MAFPTLSLQPAFPVQEEAENNVISSRMEAGYVLTRPRFTRSRTKFTLHYPLLPLADVTLLKAHEASVGYSTIFTWTHPADNATTYNVRYLSPIKYSLVSPDTYRVSIILQEV